MPRFRSVLILALLVVALTSVAPASAGGPTSALLSVPGEGRTASLYYTDPEYDALADLVEFTGNGGVGTVDTSGASHESGPGVTVTWLIHDVSPWRVDRIYLQGKGAPWIATQYIDEGGSSFDSEVMWHQPEAGDELAALLGKLGLAKASKAGDFTGVAGAPVEPPAGTSAETPLEQSAPAAAPDTTSGLAGIWWGLGGLVLGALAAVLWRRRPRRAEAAEPKAPGPDDHVGADGLVVTEELSWPARRA